MRIIELELGKTGPGEKALAELERKKIKDLGTKTDVLLDRFGETVSIDTVGMMPNGEIVPTTTRYRRTPPVKFRRLEMNIRVIERFEDPASPQTRTSIDMVGYPILNGAARPLTLVRIPPTQESDPTDCYGKIIGPAGIDTALQRINFITSDLTANSKD